jgi:hypothetical protein
MSSQLLKTLTVAIAWLSIGCVEKPRASDPTEPAFSSIRPFVRYKHYQDNTVRLPKGHLPDSLQIWVSGRRVYDRDSLAVANADIARIEIIRGDSARSRFGASARVVVVVTVDSAVFRRHHPL